MWKNLDLSKYKGIACDSSKAEKNYIFVAIKGLKLDGHDFINHAIEKGASLIIADKSYNRTDGHHYIKVENTRLALAELAALFYPNQPEYLMAVTGTNGKTSTVSFYRQICHLLGKKSASLGTVGIDSDEPIIMKDSMTTPNPIQLHYLLNELKNKNVDYVGIEASSHGLDQDRLAGARIKAACFTNLTQDHLDYHGNMENYFQAKLLLFTNVLKEGTAIINIDDSYGREIVKVCQEKGHQVITIGKGQEADIRFRLSQNDGKSHVNIAYKNQIFQIESKLLGEFQIYNLACAIGLASVAGFQFEDMIKIIPEITSVRGRMEFVGDKKHNIYIDFAHTPDSLERVLKNARQFTSGKLIVVFGCGGDRDKTKRPIMGKIAFKNADIAIITDDNPRTEDPNLIRNEIASKCPGAMQIADRYEAIKHAINIIKSPHDTLIIAGKGHETGQEINNKILDFDDAKVVNLLLRKI